jgi:hypothetical protein
LLGAPAMLLRRLLILLSIPDMVGPKARPPSLHLLLLVLPQLMRDTRLLLLLLFLPSWLLLLSLTRPQPPLLLLRAQGSPAAAKGVPGASTADSISPRPCASIWPSSGTGGMLLGTLRRCSCWCCRWAPGGVLLQASCPHPGCCHQLASSAQRSSAACRCLCLTTAADRAVVMAGGRGSSPGHGEAGAGGEGEGSEGSSW